MITENGIQHVDKQIKKSTFVPLPAGIFNQNNICSQLSKFIRHIGCSEDSIGSIGMSNVERVYTCEWLGIQKGVLLPELYIQVHTGTDVQEFTDTFYKTLKYQQAQQNDVKFDLDFNVPYRYFCCQLFQVRPIQP